MALSETSIPIPGGDDALVPSFMRAYDTTDSNARESTGDYEEEKRLKKLQEEGKLPSKERARRLSFRTLTLVMTKQVEMTSKFCPCLPAVFQWLINFKWPQAPEPDQSYWINTTQGSLCFGALISLNALLMGFETEFGEAKAFWTTMEVLFIIIFTGEIFFRIRAEGWWYPFDTWNILDVVVVGVGYASLAVQGMEKDGEEGGSDHLQITLMIRVFRLLRLIRIIKVIRFFPELALLVGGVVNSMKTLGWVFVLIMLVSWVWAIVFTKMLGQRDAVIVIAYAGSCRDEFKYTSQLDPARGLNCEADLDPEFCFQRAEVACEIIGWFGSVPQSIISLIMTGTLEAYIAYARAAMRTEVGGHPAFVCLFIAYIYFINMTLLNLITGVIVETVLQLARKDEIVEVNRQREEMDKNRRAMKSIFGLADRDSDAEVSFEEFHNALQSDKVVEHLHVLEITAADAAELFEIVDVDRSNTISMEEFMDGFGRLKGTAQAKHLLKLQCDGQRANTQLTTCLQAVERDMDERNEGLTLLVEESCSAWERRMLAHLGPGYAPWIAEMDFQECSRTVMQLQREVAELAASSPQLQEALRAKGVPLGTLTPAPESSDEVVVHARALGANLAALQLTCG